MRILSILLLILWTAACIAGSWFLGALGKSMAAMSAGSGGGNHGSFGSIVFASIVWAVPVIVYNVAIASILRSAKSEKKEQEPNQAPATVIKKQD